MKFVVVVAITPEELEEEAVQRAQAEGAAGVTVLAGKGLSAEARRTFFGLTFEGSQSVLVMVVARHVAMGILKGMRELLVRDGDSRGLAFSLPVEHIAGLDMEQVLAFDKRLQGKEG
ncbi:transcriptional regulator [uncultured Ornithinimicrobium sp.]|uniref:transcriptional regulator n=1 Tax=uncultured Ornithinimicrobium sp. TaxID=259307 RepID=UPI0025956D9D|nr:transcriptional regulator [uncultured Ornithinimicrobium sp.]